MPAARPFLALALTGLALGACTTRDAARGPAAPPRYASLDAAPGPRPAGSTAPVATPVAVLPAWAGSPVRLRERDAADAFEQVVSLGLAPRGARRENVVLLRMPRGDPAAESGPAPGGRPSEAGIRAELAAAFPDTPMQVVTRPAANAYGPYGLAIGRGPGGARCLYAWQWIAEAPALDPAADGRGPLSLRVRLCRDDVAFEALAAAMNQITLVPRFAGAAVTQAALRARSAPRRSGTARPRDAGLPGARAAATVRADPTPAEMPASGRRYLGAVEPPPAPADAGRTARDTGPGPAAASRGSIGAAPAAWTEVVAADLPPEALRGPAARPAGRP